MTLLTRYLAKEFLRLFGLGLGALLAIYWVVDLFENIDEFVRYQASARTVAAYFLYKTPLILSQVVPVAVLLATLLSLGLLARRSEIVAMRASGISLVRIAGPILALALAISGVVLVAGETVIPHATRMALHIKQVVIEKRPPRVFRQNKVWMRTSGNWILNIGLISPDEDVLYEVHGFRFDRDFRLVERVHAQEMRWEKGTWILHRGRRWRFPAPYRVEEEGFDRRPFGIVEKPQDFRRVERDTDEMSFRELRAYVQRLQRGGHQATYYEVEMHKKLAFPFASLIMALIGIPYALRGNPRNTSIAVGVGVSLIVSFGYWVVLSIGLSLGHAGKLPPLLAAWAANLLFAFAGTYLLMDVRH